MSDTVITGTAVVDGTVDPALAKWERRPPRLSRMDRLCTLALVAAERALADAGVDPKDWNSERVGVVVGTAFGCHATNEEYYRGVIEGGATGASPRLFAYTLPSSPLGEVTIHYGARGPAETIVSGKHAGLEAIGRAHALCAAGRADVCIAVAVEVATPTLARLGPACIAGAVAFVVEDEARARGRAARVHGSVLSAASAFDPSGGLAAGDCAVTLALASRGVSEAAAARVHSDAAAANSSFKAPNPGREDGVVPAAAALVRWLDESPTPMEAGVFVATDPAGGAAALVVRAGR